MRQLRFAAILFVTACLVCGFAQKRVQLQNMYERLICVVPMVGAGTYEDPRRPMYTPAPGKAPSGIIAFSHQVSDDGRYAVVELVARDRAAFRQIFDERDRQAKFLLESQRELKVFERENTRRTRSKKNCASTKRT